MSTDALVKSRKNVLKLLVGRQIAHPERTNEHQVLEAFKSIKSLTTDEIRQGLDIMNPAACVHLLRKRGHRIRTRRLIYVDMAGRWRSMAAYFYDSQAGERS